MSVYNVHLGAEDVYKYVYIMRSRTKIGAHREIGPISTKCTHNLFEFIACSEFVNFCCCSSCQSPDNVSVVMYTFCINDRTMLLPSNNSI